MPAPVNATSNRRRRILLSPVLAAMLVASQAGAPLAAGSVTGFLQELWPEARARGVSQSVFEAAFAGFQPSSKILELTRQQPEFTTTVGQYVAKRITAAQVAKGRAMAAEWSKTLAKIEERYGVDAEAVLAIWGMETNFGGYMGGNNTIHALATLTYGGYRPEFFRNELLTALQILDAGHVSPRDMTGSWAGAMGHTQFMPSSFVKFAADFNGDGHKDIWNSIPDALASTANYLREHGWRRGETWGYEISLPPNFDFARAREMERASVAEWQAMGITRVAGRKFPRPEESARIFLPAGGHGPAFLLIANFDVIKTYNKSDSYALAVGHLADRIIGGGDFATAFPADDEALNKDQRRELQALLTRRGYDVGTPDGVIGPKTRSAIMAFQRQNGLLSDGHASGRVLRSLR